MRHNGAREKIALPASSIVKIPDNLDFDRAAGIIDHLRHAPACAGGTAPA